MFTLIVSLACFALGIWLGWEIKTARIEEDAITTLLADVLGDKDYGGEKQDNSN